MSLSRSIRSLLVLLLAGCVAGPPLVSGCARTEPVEPPAPPLAPELDRLPASSVAVVRVALGGPLGALAAQAVAASGERLQCLGKMIPSLSSITVGFVPRGRDFATMMFLDGPVAAEAVDGCGTELAKAFAMRPLPEGSSPAVRSAGGATGKPAPGWILALDLDVDRPPTGVRGPLAVAYSRLANYPVVLAATGGAALRQLSGMAATYLPLSSMGEAADQIAAMAYGLAPHPDGTAAVRLEVELLDSAAAESLARQAREIGRITALDGEKAAWQELRGMLRDVVVRRIGARRVQVDATLTAAGFASLLR
jgi:hypothetical protein